MIFLIDAIALGWIASFWNKGDAINIVIALSFASLAIVNAAIASPVVLGWIGR